MASTHAVTFRVLLPGRFVPLIITIMGNKLLGFRAPVEKLLSLRYLLAFKTLGAEILPQWLIADIISLGMISSRKRSQIPFGLHFDRVRPGLLQNQLPRPALPRIGPDARNAACVLGLLHHALQTLRDLRSRCVDFDKAHPIARTAEPGIALFGRPQYLAVMATLTVELPPQQAQTGFNLRRWEELLADAELAKFEGRVETDRHGHIILTQLAPPSHGSSQAKIACLLRDLTPKGRVLAECPISTADGVKAADVAWASPERVRELGNRVCFSQAPEICVEVLSPSNTDAEIEEKMALYFDAGATEVWLCSASGEMSFTIRAGAQPMKASRLCPAFPQQIEKM